jgi:hypothetical protein
MLALGAAAAVILALGLVTIYAFAPPGQATGLKVRVLGVYRYDPSTGQVFGRPSTHFTRTQPFAARVDWSSLPGDTVVGARWYNTLEDPVGSVGPAPARTLAAASALVPVKTPPGLHANLPDDYTLAVVRYSRGQPVELLARRVVLVERGG